MDSHVPGDAALQLWGFLSSLPSAGSLRGKAPSAGRLSSPTFIPLCLLSALGKDLHACQVFVFSLKTQAAV